jgi:hypothetical protein
MAQHLALESFEQYDDGSAIPSADYDAGYQEGFAAASAASQVDQNALQQELVQTISELGFGYAEARAQLLESLEPLFSAVAQKLLPQVGHDTFGHLLIEAVCDAAVLDAENTPVLHIHPTQRNSIVKLVEEHALDIKVCDDPDLTAHAAWIRHENKETCLDVDSLLAKISTALNAVPAGQLKDKKS